MINSISYTNYNNNITSIQKNKAETVSTPSFGCLFHKKNKVSLQNINNASSIRTNLTQPEQQQYLEILNAISSTKSENTKSNLTQAQKLDVLLKNGKLLSSNSNNSTTTLENLYKILKSQRIEGLSGVKLLNQTIDAIFDPTIITQHFGDIPDSVKKEIARNPEMMKQINTPLNEMDVTASGTCTATSIEYMMANKMPSEFARWVNELSSPKNSVTQNIKSNSLSKNPLETLEFFKFFGLVPNNVNFDNYTFELKPDKNAIIRALVQNDYHDPGERSIIDVLIQSTIMNTGSKNTYNTLSDKRADDVIEGLREEEKTFMESIIQNREKTSIVYLDIDDNQNVKNRRCSVKKTEQHIKNALKQGEDVIIGYRDVADNQVFWHEITITGMKTDFLGRTIFICNDTDDDKENLIEYKAKDLIPKIHHATYPAELVENETDLIDVV